MSRVPEPSLVFSTLHLPRPLETPQVVRLLERLAADRDAPRLVLEISATEHGVRHLLGCRSTDVQALRRLLGDLLPGTTLTGLDQPRLPMQAVGHLSVHPAGLALRTDTAEATTRAVLSTMATRLRSGEGITLQILLGPRRAPGVTPARVPDPHRPWFDRLLSGDRPASPEVRNQLRQRTSVAGFRTTIRLGAASPDAGRRRRFIVSLLGAVSTAQSPGVHIDLVREKPRSLGEARQPWRWPLQLSTTELVGLLGWPLGEGDLPGLPPAHPKRLRPADDVHSGERVFAISAAPGDDRKLGISAADQMMHSVAYGPSGSGKTNAMTHLILADIRAGRSVCVVDPKWQLVEDLLARMPSDRLDDVVVLDAARPNPVGFNPLDTGGRDPDVVVDGILAVFSAIFASGWGPRTEDIISAALRTLAKSNPAGQSATLIDLPRILTDPAYRRPRVVRVSGDAGLAGFWAWYEGLSPGGQANAIAAPLNKIRSLLLRPALVRMLSQRGERFRLRDIWRQNKIVLVPLNEGLIGSGTAALLGSLVIADLWQATQERASEKDANKRPGVVYIDEAPRFLHLPVSMADALAVSRSLWVGWFLAAQFRSQFPPELRTAVDMNARSKIVFSTEYDDARDMARLAPELSAEDFMALPRFHAYANLVAGGHPSGWAMVKTLPPTPATTDPLAVSALSERNYAPAPVPTEVPEDQPADLPDPTPVAGGRIGRKRRTR